MTSLTRMWLRCFVRLAGFQRRDPLRASCTMRGNGCRGCAATIPRSARRARPFRADRYISDALDAGAFDGEPGP